MRQFDVRYKKSYVKGENGFWYPRGLSKTEKKVFASGTLPKKVKVEVAVPTFRGTDSLLKNVLGYQLDAIATKNKRFYAIYKLTKEI